MADPIFEGAKGRQLRFDFLPDWRAVKFDDSAWYRDDIKSHVKAMDVLASDGTAHWWIEVKDCEGFEKDNLPRLSPADPPEVEATRAWVANQGYTGTVAVRRSKPFVVDEVAEKLEGTLVGVTAAARSAASQVSAAALAPFAKVTYGPAPWSVVLLLTWRPDARDFGRLAMRLRDKLCQRLAAYKVQCFVLNETESAPEQPWTLTRVNK
jgi:hypothetical protein